MRAHTRFTLRTPPLAMRRVQSLFGLAVLFFTLTIPAAAQQSRPVGAASSVRASPHTAPPEDTSEAVAGRKNPNRAVLYSVGGTVFLAPVFGVGLIVGPAFGHFYADNVDRARNGIMLRGGAAVAPVVLGALATAGSDEPGSAYAGLGVFLVSGILAAAVIVGSAIYDIVTADDAARAHNRSHDRQLRVTPTVGGSHGDQVGLSVTLQL